MITVDLVNEAISGIISRFEDGDYVRRTYHEVVQENDEVGPEEIHFFIEDEIDTTNLKDKITSQLELVLEVYKNNVIPKKHKLQSAGNILSIILLLVFSSLTHLLLHNM